MNDRRRCWATYKENQNYQLVETTMLVKVPGGIRNYQLRFDDDEAEPRVNLSDDEGALGLFTLSDQQFARFLNASRFRFVGLTLLKNDFAEDMALDGVKPALANIGAGCPAPPPAAAQPPVAPEKKKHRASARN